MSHIQRRVAGFHDVRLDGVSDILMRAKDKSVLDLGCNRGMVGYEFAVNGARLVHGCDNYEPGVAAAREIFADLRSVKSQHEVLSLSQPYTLDVFGREVVYDFVLALAVIHKISRVMRDETLRDLISLLGTKCRRYFVWRGTQTDKKVNESEIEMITGILQSKKFVVVQYSEISDLGPAAVWEKK